MLASNNPLQTAADFVSRIKWNFKTDGAPHCCPHCGGEEFFQKITFSTRDIYSQAAKTNREIHRRNHHDLMSIYCNTCKNKLGSIEETQVVAI